MAVRVIPGVPGNTASDELRVAASSLCLAMCWMLVSHTLTAPVWTWTLRRLNPVRRTCVGESYRSTAAPPSHPGPPTLRTPSRYHQPRVGNISTISPSQQHPEAPLGHLQQWKCHGFKTFSASPLGCYLDRSEMPSIPPPKPLS